MGVIRSLPAWWPVVAIGGAVGLVAVAFMSCAVAHLVVSWSARLYSSDVGERTAKREEWLRILADMKPGERPAHAGSLLWTAVLRRARRVAPDVELEVGRHVLMGFRVPQVCKIVGITYRQLDYWARTDLLRPSLAETQGTGTQRRYSYRDLLELKVIKRLLDAAMPLESVRYVLYLLRTNVTTDSAVLALEPTAVLATAGGEIEGAIHRSTDGVVTVVPLTRIRDELDAAIRELAAGIDRPS